MNNDRQQPPVPPQGQPPYQGWQYDQEQTEAPRQPQPPARPAPPVVPSQFSPAFPPRGTGARLPLPSQPLPALHSPQSPPIPPQSPYPAQSPVPQSPYPQPPQNVPARYQEPIADMGTSLGYNQTTEYQYFQPSQEMPRLRMERFQQLRQERLQRERRQGRPDITSYIPWRKNSRNLPLNSLQSAQALPPQAQPGPLTPGVAPGAARSQSQPLISSKHPAFPAVEPAQDTGMIQRVRVGRASMILALAFIASRVLGLVRSAMFATIFGTTAISDAYVQAFIVPDTIFTIVAGGALSSAFIPVFTKHMTDEDEKGAWHLANTAMTLSIALMAVLALIAIIFAQPLVMLYNPIAAHQTLHDYQLKINLMTVLIRIMLFQPLILGVDVIVTSVLNAQKDFVLPAVGSVFYNVGLIVGLLPGMALALFGQMKDQGHQQFAMYCAAIGVVLGAVVMVAIEVPGLKKVGMQLKPSFDWRLPDVRQIGKQMIPRMFNAAAFSFTTFVDRYMIGLLGVVVVVTVTKAVTKGTNPTDGLQTQYFYAYTLVMLPLGIIGQAMSTAAFPTLAEYVSKGRMERVRQIILETLRNILFLAVPASLGLIVLSVPIIQALFQHGSFTLDNALSTAVPLSFFAVGLVGLSAVEILTRAFYAMRDSKTPVIVSIAQFGLKVALSLVLIDPFALLGGPAWGMGGLAFATSIASICEGLVLFLLLNQRIGALFERALGVFLIRVFFAALAMAIGIILFRIILDAMLNTTNAAGPHYITAILPGLIAKFFKLGVELLVGTFVFLRAARFLKLQELEVMRPLLARFKLAWLV